jgi:hypothetical protein
MTGLGKQTIESKLVADEYPCIAFSSERLGSEC